METELQRLIALMHEAMDEKIVWTLAYGGRYGGQMSRKWRVYISGMDPPVGDTPEEALRGALRRIADESAAFVDKADTTARQVRADAERLRKLADRA